MNKFRIFKGKKLYIQMCLLCICLLTICLLALVFLDAGGFCEENSNFNIGYKLCYLKGLYPAAIEYFKKGLEEDLSNEPARRYLALSYEKEKNFAEAISVWEEYISLYSDDRIRSHIKNIKELKGVGEDSDSSQVSYNALLRIAEDNYPESPVSFYALTAILHQHFIEKDYPMVITLYGKINKAHPKEKLETETLYEYAYSLIEAKQVTAAGKILEKMLKYQVINYDRAKIENLAATCYLSEATEYLAKNEKSSALKIYDRIITQCPESDKVNFAKEQREILFKESDNFLRKADHLIFLTLKGTDEAGNLYSKLLEEYPEHPKRDHILFNYTETIMAKKQYQKALELYLQFVSKYSNSSYAPEAMFRAAQCYLKLNDREKAMSLFDKIIVKYPRSSSSCEALFSLGSQYAVHLKDTNAALKYYNKLIVNFPNSRQAKDAQEITKELKQYEEKKKKEEMESKKK